MGSFEIAIGHEYTFKNKSEGHSIILNATQHNAGTLSLTCSHRPSNFPGYLCLLEDKLDRNLQVSLVRDSMDPFDCVHTLPTSIFSSNAISGTCAEAHGRG